MSTGKKRPCFCQTLVEKLRTRQKLVLPLSVYSEKSLLQELKKRLKSGSIKFDYDLWDWEIGLTCENYEFRFAELGFDWPPGIPPKSS